MIGTLALVGAGEFLDTMKGVDEKLLEMAGGTRVVVLPTASAPDGPGVPERWARMGVEHFKRLGAQVDAVLALNRADCTDPAFAARVCAADFVYFSGGKPDYLVKTLVDTPVWRAVQAVLDRGGAVAGCSAGAMIMGSHVPSFSFGGSAFHIAGWLPGFALVPHAVIAPHYDEFPETIAKQLLTRLPPESILIGVDAHTALIGSSGRWAAMGAGRVTLHRGNRVTRYTAGQAVPVDETSG